MSRHVTVNTVCRSYRDSYLMVLFGTVVAVYCEGHKCTVWTKRRVVLCVTGWYMKFQLCFRGLTFRLLMSYIYGAPILDVSRSHTTTQHSR